MKFGLFLSTCMIIQKVINNNVLSAIDSKNREVILTIAEEDE